jgi:hypothetical protein
MKKFMALYMGSGDARTRSDWDALSEADRSDREQAGMAAWGEWMTRNQTAILDAGGPLGTTKRAATDGISDTRNQVAAYVIVQAESHQAAVDLFSEQRSAIQPPACFDGLSATGGVAGGISYRFTPIGGS